MTVNGGWINCLHCNSRHLVATALIESGCCFSCYMKGLGPGEIDGWTS